MQPLTTDINSINADAFKSSALAQSLVEDPLNPSTFINRRNFSFASQDYDRDGVVDLLVIKKSGTSTNYTEVHVLDGSTNYQTWLLNIATPLGATGEDWSLAVQDYNRDGIVDIFGFKKFGTDDKKIEIHVLDGSTNYQTWLLHTETPLGETRDDCDFTVQDYNRDGILDLFVIKKSGTSTNYTEVHILDGSTNYQTQLLNVATPLGATGGDWSFVVQDYNRDGIVDIFGFKKFGTDDKKIEIHVLDGSTNYQTWMLYAATPLGETINDWDFTVQDYNRDGIVDVIGIKKFGTASKSAEVNVLDGANGFQSWLLHTGTPLRETGGNVTRPQPPIPELQTWETQMLTSGQAAYNVLKELKGSSDLDKKFGAVYYDGGSIFSQIAKYTGDTSWYAAADLANSFNKEYIFTNIAVTGYNNFSDGLEEQYFRAKAAKPETAETAEMAETARNAIALLAASAPYTSFKTNDHLEDPLSNSKENIPTSNWYLSREVAYGINTLLSAKRVGLFKESDEYFLSLYKDENGKFIPDKYIEQSDRNFGAQMQNRLGVLINYAHNHLEQLFNTEAASDERIYVKPFMVGLTIKSLIEYAKETGDDSWLVQHLPNMLAEMWDEAWIPEKQTFRYIDRIPSNPSRLDNPDNPNDPVHLAPSPDLNLLIAPAYQWVYLKTGQELFRERADAIFAEGVQQAYLSKNKQFNQNYFWSFDYVKERQNISSNPDLTVPNPLDPLQGITNWTIAGIADFTGDGKADILWRQPKTGELSFWRMNGTNYVESIPFGNSATDWTIAGIADFTGDGKADILWRQPKTGELSFWRMNGTNYVESIPFGNSATDWTIAGIADFTGDGKADILWRQPKTGELSFWRMDSTNYVESIPFGNSATDWTIAGASDFTGDAKADILWRQPKTGELSFWRMNGMNYAESIPFGIISAVE